MTKKLTKKCTFITQYNRSSDTICKLGAIKFTKPTQVKESLAYATDINQIYNNYCKTGKLPLNGNQPIYDENFISYDSLIEAQQAVKEASLYFSTLPAEIRSHYGNNLENFVKAIHSNDEFLRSKGVLKTIEKTEITSNPVPEPVGVSTVATPPVSSITPATPASGEGTTVSGSSD